MNNLIKKIEEIKKNSIIKKEIDQRIKEFLKFQNKEEITNKELFIELSFCLLTANFNAEKSITIQKEINKGFLTLNKEALAKKLRVLHHRYPETRANYIVNARSIKDNLKDTLFNKLTNDKERRAWLVKNVKGLGLKEASHFLRNTGFFNVAIIDFHIIDLLEKYDIIKRPKTLTRKKYLEIEQALEKIAKEVNLTLGELDLYLWYMETGKILK